MKYNKYLITEKKLTCDTCKWKRTSIYGSVCTNPDWYDKTPFSNRLGIPTKIKMAKNKEDVLPSCPIKHPKK
jgi:hypothetical protein